MGQDRRRPEEDARIRRELAELEARRKEKAKERKDTKTEKHKKDT